ncbi:hypothetical protein N8135_01605 [Oceanospirillaceae bacterium]|nr:hypothetical protein [Oceanospirillaceae bacterium]
MLIGRNQIMIKNNRYKAKKVHFIAFGLATIFFILLLSKSINILRMADNELQNFQSNFSSFSSLRQLTDDGTFGSGGASRSQIFIGALEKIPAIIYDRFASDVADDLPKVELFIKFKHLEEIYGDRSSAILKGVNTNPQYVPCKISDGFKIFKCKVRLKGDLADHWNTRSRLSFKIKVKGGYIRGMNSFAIQKPRTRQFPYDHIFHEINADLGRISSNHQDYATITVNGDRWGVMAIEPTIDDTFIETRDLKRSGVFRISDQKIWAYRKNKDSYDGYYLSDPTVTISQSGNADELFKDAAAKEIYSHIYRSINTKAGNIFNRKLMIGNLGLALAWGDLHTLKNSNSKYAWNSYEQKLEPILSDQAGSRNISILMNTPGKQFLNLPYEFKIIFQENPLKVQELMDEVLILDDYFKSHSVIEKANFLKDRYFKNDNKFSKTDIYRNINYLKNNIKDVVFKINRSSALRGDSSVQILDKKQIDLIDNFVKVVHFDNGIVRVYNYLNQPVNLVELIAGGMKLKINKNISGSEVNSLRFIDVETDFLGDFSGMINVTAAVKGVNKASKNAASITDFDYSRVKPRTALSAGLCNDNNEQDDICLISGSHVITESVQFNKKAVINPGTKLTLGVGADLIFESSVYMNGLKASPIEIQGNGTGGIFIKNESTAVSTLKHVNVSRLATTSSPLRKYSGAINGYGGEFNIDNLMIDGCESEDQLNLVHTRISIDGLFISNAPSDAFDCDFCIGSAANISFRNIGGDGLDVSGSKLKIIAMDALLIEDKALSVGERSSLTLYGATFDNVGTGVAVKDASNMVIDGIEMRNIRYDAFMTYVKKPFFVGKTALDVSRLEGIEVAGKSVCIREENTHLTLNGKLCEISELSVDELYKGRMKK